MTEATRTPDVELFGHDSIDDLITSIDGKRDQIDVVLDIVYSYFTHTEPGEKELTAIQWHFGKIRTLIEIASDALAGITEQVERWNAIAREVRRKHEQEQKEGAAVEL